MGRKRRTINQLYRYGIKCSSYAKTLNLNIGEFDNCLNTGKYRDAVSKNITLAKGLGITGVPGFIIGAVSAV